jgi:uncharacterized membrane protein (UPF0127 family)
MVFAGRKISRIHTVYFIVLMLVIFTLFSVINRASSDKESSGQIFNRDQMCSSISETGQENHLNAPQGKLPTRELTIGETVITVEVADNDNSRSMGLSWRESLGEKEGMLFVYENPEIPNFWMYGMQFPLDFIWINDGKVVDVSKNIQHPSTIEEIPVTVSPGTEITQVLEVNAGFVEKYNIKTGDTVELR